MPRNGSGVYSADWVNAAPNTTIESAKQNAMVADLVADANAARPITSGGTGETTARLKDGTWRFQNTADTSKLLAFDLSGLTTATTRTITMGDANVTLRPQAWELIETKTISVAAATADFLNLGAYRMLRLTGYALPATDGATLWARTSTDNGSSWLELSVYTNQILVANNTAVAGARSTDAAILLTNSTGNGADEGALVNSVAAQFNVNAPTFIQGAAGGVGPTPNLTTITTMGTSPAAVNNALRIMFSSGNIAAGSNLVLEGIRG